MSTTESFHPGSYSPAPGTYVCDCSGSHLWRIDLAGHLFPTFPAACTGRTWRASAPTGPAPAAGPVSDAEPGAAAEPA
ncbi:hypothetical protein ACFU3J_29095 [Streptomyces sp. NPDC057411]|uniref:hypothetical protein n=1 Tax=unclassified Streptomyces TaxID=2593676 RepID=UPI00362557BA